MAHAGCRLLLAAVLVAMAAPLRAACPPPGQDSASLQALRATGFEVTDAGERETLAMALLDCLGDPDPALRDGIGYEALSRWMRADAFAPAMLRRLRDRLEAMLVEEDPAGFRRPFAALVLSEVARTDRIKPWMSPQERSAMVATATGWLRAVNDYRGFDPQEGWRHGVAHGADWLMQLALNPALDPAGADAMLAAIAEQVAPATGHAYVFGEPERLARPLLSLGARGLVSPATLDAWLAALVAGLQPARYTDPAWLAQRHDVLAFVRILHVETALSNDAAVSALHPAADKALRTLR
ncbi:MAG: DUF2785 domain-containing protein [Pseudomonadota bacterium]|nr:DUF2785 domain-containing protein [Pseudomonadota bacterium]